MNTVKVFIADNHEWFRRLLTDYVGSQDGFEIVGETADAGEIIPKVRQLNPDLVLIDQDIPQQGGFQAVREIKQIAPQTKVLILSAHPEYVYSDRAKENQADEFIVKSSAKNRLSSYLSFVRSSNLNQ